MAFSLTDNRTIYSVGLGAYVALILSSQKPFLPVFPLVTRVVSTVVLSYAVCTGSNIGVNK